MILLIVSMNAYRNANRYMIRIIFIQYNLKYLYYNGCADKYINIHLTVTKISLARLLTALLISSDEADEYSDDCLISLCKTEE